MVIPFNILLIYFFNKIPFLLKKKKSVIQWSITILRYKLFFKIKNNLYIYCTNHEFNESLDIYIVQKINVVSYIEDFHNTLLRYFIESVDPINKQNRWWLVDHTCITTTLNCIISGGKWGCNIIVLDLVSMMTLDPRGWAFRDGNEAGFFGYPPLMRWGLNLINGFGTGMRFFFKLGPGSGITPSCPALFTYKINFKIKLN